ncbi:MAG: hypothetical protein SNF33_02375 [Candidatus Algichlamydia australiensis]|nr:hypothetical protein [Chlamydiales bacterium]
MKKLIYAFAFLSIIFGSSVCASENLGARRKIYVDLSELKIDEDRIMLRQEAFGVQIALNALRSDSGTGFYYYENEDEKWICPGCHTEHNGSYTGVPCSVCGFPIWN